MTDISVIIPTMNRVGLLKSTLDNVLGQSLKPLEVIVVDDGSTDGTKEMILNDFKDRVKYVINKGKGPGAARNTGFAISRGNYIQFFDSDDIMTNNKLEVQAGLLDIHLSIDMVYGPYVMVEHTGQQWRQLDAILQFERLPNKPLNMLVAEGWCAITQSCLFRRSVVEKAGPWREDLMPHEDKEYWYRLGKVIKNSLHEKKSCVFYRQHRQQITDLQVKQIPRTIDAIKAFDMIIDQMEKDKVSFFSKMMCAGIRAGYVKFLNRHNHYEYINSLTGIVYYNFYRIIQKIGRMRTKTNWQPFHGAFEDQHQFEAYRIMIDPK